MRLATYCLLAVIWEVFHIVVAIPTSVDEGGEETADDIFTGPAERSGIRGWGALEISPNAFLSIVYQGTFRISVYRNQATDPALVQYYYSPALVIDPSSSSSDFNSFTKRFEMTFAVLMWDEPYETFIKKKLSEKTGQTVPLSNIRILPIEEIRIEAIGHSDEYDVNNKWTSYANQPANFRFRINCLKNETCRQVADDMRSSPQNFVSDMVVYYSLQSQKSPRRTIQVKAEHVQSVSLFTTLDQRFPNKDSVYMKSDDLKKLTQEIAKNVVATEVTDEEFVSQDQSITVSTLLENVLKAQAVSSASFDSQMWDSVFWQDDNGRPDKITQSLNDVYNKSDSTVQDALKQYLSSSSNTQASVGVSVSILSGLFGGSASGSGSSSSQTITNEERDKLVKLLTESKATSQWNGEKFIPRPMELSRINLSGFRGGQVITTTQVRVTKTTSELSSRINILPSAAVAGEIPQQRAEIYRLQQELNEFKDLIRSHNASLADERSRTQLELDNLKNDISTQHNLINSSTMNSANQHASFSLSLRNLESKCNSRTITVDRIIFGDGRWSIQPESKVLVFRDNRSGGDKRYAMYDGRYRDL